MCLVEVGSPRRNPDGTFVFDENMQIAIAYMPKLQIACNTFVSDEMRINTNTPKVIKARAAVMEFILINHPLDCPICDEAGKCKLQDYSTLYSKEGSRFSETKNANIKRTP
jgi:NADH-quinone oxidoreductase subunit G